MTVYIQLNASVCVLLHALSCDLRSTRMSQTGSVKVVPFSTPFLPGCGESSMYYEGVDLREWPGQSTTTGIKNCGRDYFKCQHNVRSCARRSNVQMVLSGKQLIDQAQFGLLWLL